MKVFRAIKETAFFVSKFKLQGRSIGLVTTMGALHAGHLSLIRQARKENDIAAVSIFINPAQFGPKEDFKKYPRATAKDLRLCRQQGVDFVFMPRVDAMYPYSYQTYVEVRELSVGLCARHRPGHFKGVATVVAKLFNIIRPDIAYFGQKDYQQALIIKKMAADLNLPVRIKVMPIIREKDGLAMSSRNIYLNSEQRLDAAVLYRALNTARGMVKKGSADASKITAEMRKLILSVGQAKIDYIAIVDSRTLKPLAKARAGTLIAVAVWIGKTRLIDNVVIR